MLERSLGWTALINPIHLPSHSTMFTGLVEHLGVISDVKPTTEFAGYSFTISDSKSILDDCHLGDSIAVNGCCLTVTSFDSDSFTVGLANETLNRTDLGQLHLPMSRVWGARRLTRGSPSCRKPQRREQGQLGESNGWAWKVRGSFRTGEISLITIRRCVPALPHVGSPSPLTDISMSRTQSI